MKYKFLYDNLKEKDIVEFEECGDLRFTTVKQVHCNCYPKDWGEHFHIGPYICQYDSGKASHSDRVCSIWRYKDKKTLKRVAKKHPRTKVWEIDEDMLEDRLNGDISKVKEAIKKLDLYVKEVENEN